VLVSKEGFDHLLAVVSQGRLPSILAIEVEGLTRESGGTKWDNKNTPTLPIAGIKFDIPLSGGDPHDVFDGQTIDDSNPPTRAQLDKLLERVDHIRIGVGIAILFLASLLWRGH